jgi:penicillin-binding protein 1A
VGGTDFKDSQFNRAAQALRSPGSTFKLFVYLTALQQGMLPERIFRDSARCFAGYCPKNFGNRYFGAVSMVVALQNSLNTVAVGLLQELGFDKVIETAKNLGITRELGRFYPLALGATEQTVVDMTAAYAAINNGGIYVKPTPFEEILGPDGELLWSRRVDGDQGSRAVTTDIAALMLWMLERAVRSGTGGGAALPDRPVAGKTGTSEGGRDLWFIGSIPQLTTGVWLGYDDSRTTKSTSVVATYAWRAFMAPISKDLPVRPFPPKPQLEDTYRLDKKQAERRSEPAANPESLGETAPQPLELDPTPSLNEQPNTPAAPPSPAPTTPPPLEAPPPPMVAPPTP